MRKSNAPVNPKNYTFPIAPATNLVADRGDHWTEQQRPSFEESAILSEVRHYLAGEVLLRC
jgi:hypothetical protein